MANALANTLVGNQEKLTIFTNAHIVSIMCYEVVEKSLPAMTYYSHIHCKSGAHLE